MSTSNSLTPPLHKLERLLLDGDIDPELADYLRAVGFDVKVLRLARKQGRILVCHDQHSDKETRLRLYPELHNHGGKILQIGGDSSQMVLTALGKILVWRENWEPWFIGNDGKVVVYKDRWIPKSALTLVNLTIAQQGYDIGQVPFSLKRKPRKKTSRKRPIAPEQHRLMV